MRLILMAIGVVYMFSGCVTKELKPLAKFPHYDKDKANVYVLNNETELGYQQEYKYTISSKDTEKEVMICFSQYSYQALEEGKYKFSISTNGVIIGGNREDNIPYEANIKKGDIYVLKPQTSIDLLSVGKMFVAALGSVDPHIELKRIDNKEGLIEIRKGMEFTNTFTGKRPYPYRAEDNNETSCIKVAAKRF